MGNEYNYVKCPKCSHDRNASTLKKCEICGQELGKGGPPIPLLIGIGIFLLATLGASYFLFRTGLGSSTASNANSAGTAPSFASNANSAVDPSPSFAARNVDYSQLREYLRQKNWRSADRETYERLLEAAGPKAQAKGFTPQDEIDTLSCNDLKTVDKLWSEASLGKQGFTAQENIFRALGDWKKTYAQVGWSTISGTPLIDWNYNPQTKRMEYKPGKEPNFKNPPTASLPTVERNYNFDVSFDGALKRCGF